MSTPREGYNLIPAVFSCRPGLATRHPRHDHVVGGKLGPSAYSTLLEMIKMLDTDITQALRAR